MQMFRFLDYLVHWDTVHEKFIFVLHPVVGGYTTWNLVIQAALVLPPFLASNTAQPRRHRESSLLGCWEARLLLPHHGTPNIEENKGKLMDTVNSQCHSTGVSPPIWTGPWGLFCIVSICFINNSSEKDSGHFQYWKPNFCYHWATLLVCFLFRFTVLQAIPLLPPEETTSPEVRGFFPTVLWQKVLKTLCTLMWVLLWQLI